MHCVGGKSESLNVTAGGLYIINCGQGTLCNGLVSAKPVGLTTGDILKTNYLIIFFPVALRPNAGHGLLILEVSRSPTTMHHSL